MLIQKLVSRTKFQPILCQKFGSTTTLKVKQESNNYGKIKTWQVHSYGGLEELQLSNSRSPIIRNPNDIIVEVASTSVNPIDIAMMSGYGSVLLNFMRQTKARSWSSVLEFPLTLGRDFSGKVAEKGHGVGEEFSIGDEVWGVVPIYEQGCHAEQVIVPKNCIKKKPENLSMTEAGSMLYAAVTAWSALKITGDAMLLPLNGKIALVLGGSGGVGSMAVQLLSSWGAHVVATCSTDAIPLLESLKVPEIIDYKQEDHMQKIQEHKYDIILDCAGIGQENASPYVKCLKDYNLSKFITLKSPMLKNFDEHGMLAGSVKNVADLMLINFTTGVLPKTSTVRWGFFIPLETALNEISDEVTNKRLVPVIQKSYSFSELPAAYEHVKSGHLRGKIIVDVISKSS